PALQSRCRRRYPAGTSPPGPHTLSLHDALPISARPEQLGEYLLSKGLISKKVLTAALMEQKVCGDRIGTILVRNGFISYRDLIRSEEHTSELQSRENLVCRLLLEKKKHHQPHHG